MVCCRFIHVVVTVGSSMNLVVVGLIHGFGLLWGKVRFGLLLSCFGHARDKNNSESLRFT